MRLRLLVHVAGGAGGGKTTFVERVVEADLGDALCVRATRDVRLSRPLESEGRGDPELARYRRAGASHAVSYQFPGPDIDTFFMRDFMQEYSQIVLIEGDPPFDFTDLNVFVTSPPDEGRSLLQRVERDHTAEREASIRELESALESTEELVALLGDKLGVPGIGGAVAGSPVVEKLRQSMKAELAEIRDLPPPAPTEHWALDEEYAGIERAHLVVVNVRSAAEREASGAFLDDVARLRRDEEVFRDVLWRRGKKIAITATAADLADARDAGTKKAIARVRRAYAKLSR